ncbi:hypothetical protein C2E20_2707 [Micractinium conductrix]|uniref:Uncharacterized protein n=1 Tax=Micractinium conductrix TaxID=554055 RepID=A0A2P6VIU0_9CHLO|nr:hypothetical protein C2E20_2707 [Micractinium conductrix]|eukprot:PSC73967.1 hypothetical protein C2E20_2707 [Micractinium conductrix]
MHFGRPQASRGRSVAGSPSGTYYGSCLHGDASLIVYSAFSCPGTSSGYKSSSLSTQPAPPPPPPPPPGPPSPSPPPNPWASPVIIPSLPYLSSPIRPASLLPGSSPVECSYTRANVAVFRFQAAAGMSGTVRASSCGRSQGFDSVVSILSSTSETAGFECVGGNDYVNEGGLFTSHVCYGFTPSTLCLTWCRAGSTGWQWDDYWGDSSVMQVSVDFTASAALQPPTPRTRPT